MISVKNKKILTLAIVVLVSLSLFVIGRSVISKLTRPEKNSKESEIALNTDTTVADLMKNKKGQKQIYELPLVTVDDIEPITEQTGVSTFSMKFINHSQNKIKNLTWILKSPEGDEISKIKHNGIVEPEGESSLETANVSADSLISGLEFLYTDNGDEFLAKYDLKNNGCQLFKIED